MENSKVDTMNEKQDNGVSVTAVPVGEKGDDYNKQGCCERLRNFLTSSKFLLYASHTLSAGGDRMWSFAVGLFLITLSPGSLRLTAIYGFVTGISVLLFGALIGDAVDRYHRLRVAQTALLVNNLATAVCAVIVCLTLIYFDDIQPMWNGWLEILCQTGIVVTATIADLAGVARQISLERDWIVVMCGGDKHELTNLSAFLRRIDLVTNLAAPIVTGQIITYGSSVIGAVFLGAWNLAFMFVEYGLLYAIYKRVPELAFKKSHDEVSEETPLIASEEGRNLKRKKSFIDSHKKLFSVFITTAHGWKTYVQQDILPAGLALAFMYMTVLGFDNVTNGYAIEQGLTESIVGILRALGAVCGVTGTLIFPRLRKKLGLKRTGVIAYACDVVLLIPCVVSVFVAGSPFAPDYYIHPDKYAQPQLVLNVNGTNIAQEDVPESMLSVWLLMGSIVVVRCTLWTCDLTVTQLLLEEPKEEVRGIVNGVQNALNKFSDLIKFVLVISLPMEETFGFLVLASFTCVAMGGVSFTVYACKPDKEAENGYENEKREKKEYEPIA